ncbi:MAG: hypothetical protein ACFB0F_13645 [Neomegalonema sp.]
MEGFLAIGFLVGMSHALEADHVAAVGAMAADPKAGRGRRNLVLRGAVWGLGHTITLFALCTLVILFGVALTDATSAALEFGVGVMLVLLGIDVLRRMRRARVHFHMHDHGDGKPHIHAHSHHGATQPHSSDQHDHEHLSGFPVRALLVGLVHGAAGSAGLLALAVAATQDPLVAVGYVGVFGVGSIAGMAALSFVAAWPRGWAERGAKWLHGALTVAVAALAITIGVGVMLETGALASDLLPQLPWIAD